jgi:hypothetical protein
VMKEAFCPLLQESFDWAFAWGPTWLDNDASNFCVNTFELFGVSSTLFLPECSGSEPVD